jgi:D-arabinose 1-dehydrogenase-like Zn-dependent alcohol dehydrogenase
VPHPKYLFDYQGIARNLAATYACSGVTAYSALKKTAPLGENAHLVIIGAGGVGFNGIHLAPSVVDAKIIVADTDPTKRSAARQAQGVVETIDNSAPDAVARVLEITGGGAAAAIDFVGRPETFGFGIDVLAKSGTLAVVGLFGGSARVPVPMFPFKSMKVCGSYVGNLQDMRELMEIVKADKVPPIPIEERPIEQVNEALTDLLEGRVLGRIVLAH